MDVKLKHGQNPQGWELGSSGAGGQGRRTVGLEEAPGELAMLVCFLTWVLGWQLLGEVNSGCTLCLYVCILCSKIRDYRHWPLASSVSPGVDLSRVYVAFFYPLLMHFT